MLLHNFAEMLQFSHIEILQTEEIVLSGRINNPGKCGNNITLLKNNVIEYNLIQLNFVITQNQLFIIYNYQYLEET
jgi:hypothetical protein